jgi:Fe-S cluster assembly protein SufD
MNATRADATDARRRLQERAWIDRRVESFRHLPPPGVGVWLGDGDAANVESPRGGPAATGWAVQPADAAGAASLLVRRLDAMDSVERAELFDGLPLAAEGDSAPFAWAHRALCRAGLRLRIGAAGGATPTVVHLRHRPDAAVAAPLLVVDVDAGADAVLTETHERDAGNDAGSIVENLQVHVRLGDGATLRHVRVALPADKDSVAHHVHARLGRAARYEQVLIATGSNYHLQRGEVELQAEAASASLAGVACAAGSAFDRQLRVSHTAACTTSAIEQLALAGAGAHMVLNAYTRIAPGADEAEVRQRLTAIPIGGQPKVVLRPHLEILHDKVQANHGATFGALPEDALFYARQRGLDEQRARALIVEGMAAAVLARGLGDARLLETLAIDRLLARVVARHLAGTATEASHA